MFVSVVLRLSNVSVPVHFVLARPSSSFSKVRVRTWVFCTHTSIPASHRSTTFHLGEVTPYFHPRSSRLSISVPSMRVHPSRFVPVHLWSLIGIPDKFLEWAGVALDRFGQFRCGQGPRVWDQTFWELCPFCVRPGAGFGIPVRTPVNGLSQSEFPSGLRIRPRRTSILVRFASPEPFLIPNCRKY